MGDDLSPCPPRSHAPMVCLAKKPTQYTHLYRIMGHASSAVQPPSIQPAGMQVFLNAQHLPSTDERAHVIAGLQRKPFSLGIPQPAYVGIPWATCEFPVDGQPSTIVQMVSPHASPDNPVQSTPPSCREGETPEQPLTITKKRAQKLFIAFIAFFAFIAWWYRWNNKQPA